MASKKAKNCKVKQLIKKYAKTYGTESANELKKECKIK